MCNRDATSEVQAQKMTRKFKSWIKTRFSADKEPERPSFRRTEFFQNPQERRPRPRPVKDHLEDAGSGKNGLIRKKYVREDTGTHETLKIFDYSLVDSGEEADIDPYNTGGFDRSKNWNNRFRN